MNRVICMSPHAGSCDKLTAGAAERTGAQTVYLRNLNISFCDGCGACAHGECKYKDDASNLLNNIRNGGKTLFVTPLYFCNFPALAKAFLDRAQAFWEKREKCESDFYLLAVGGQSEENNFRSAYLTFRAFCIAMGARFAGAEYLGRVESAADIDDNDIEKAAKMLE